MYVEKPILEVLSGRVLRQTPIWLMRQAGRYLPEYREVRKRFNNFIEFCLTPDAAAQVTLQPIERFGFDASIIFSDILVIPYALGLDIDFIEGEGPVLEPVNSADGIRALKLTRFKALEKVFEAIKIVRKELDAKYSSTTLIGFAGSPWTVACYVIAGRSDRASGRFEAVKRFAIEQSEAFLILINKIAEATIDYLNAQIEAGAEVLQLFDSWAGIIEDDEDYKKWVIEPTAKIIRAVRRKHPKARIIGFPRNSGRKRYIMYAKLTGVDAIGLSNDVVLSEISERTNGVVTQGNFNNLLLATSKKEIRQEVRSVLKSAIGKPHIFNLDHGILPTTPLENVYELMDAVRSFVG